MLLRGIQRIGRSLGAAAVLMLAFACHARASATLLLEEPYGKLGFFTATGHAAVYLSGVCAESPLVLRHCAAGETGIVLSRYNGVAGYDWVAIPLLPYLYAVNRPQDIPLFADAKMVAFLRDEYRRKYLEKIIPDAANGEAPGGNWYELVGSSYDRAIYGFQVETTAKQDEALIRKYNSLPNQSHFHTMTRNCADFTKDVINFYYPKALHRSIVADIGMTTPKQMAKGMEKFNVRHPQVEFSKIVIPQIPGGLPRSTPTHGVVESFLKSKKYIVPTAVVSPIFAGCVLAVYEGTGAGRFAPARDALVFNPGSQPEAPLGREDRRAYQKELEHLLASENPETSGPRIQKEWERLQARAKPELDKAGRPVLNIQTEEESVSVGASADNVLSRGASPQLAQEMLEARLESELRRNARPTLSENEVARDWELLQQAVKQNADQRALNEIDRRLEAHSTPQPANSSHVDAARLQLVHRNQP